MRITKKMGAIAAAAFALTLIAPTAAQAQSAEPLPAPAPAAESAELSSRIASDPSMRYVSVAEAEAQFGFDSAAEIPAAEAPRADESEAPVMTPLNDWWGCGWDGVADWPHVTNGEASVHGYWVYNSGDCPATADVTVNLQALGCSNVGCTWITQASDTAAGVASGSGTGRWATPHKGCASSSPVAWRGEVFVGLSEFWHPYGASYGTAKDLNCAPA